MRDLPQLLRRLRRLRILVVGDVMLDHYIWGDATRISPEAPVPVIDIARDSWTAGGAANVALNLASLGARCTVVGHFGADESGRRLEELLRGRGIELLSTPGDAPTIVKTRVLVRQQQLCRLDREAAPAAYEVPLERLTALIAPALADCDAVILSDYAKGILNNAVLRELTTLARSAGKLIALDPKPRRGLDFHGLDLITPSKREALQLAGLEPAPNAPFPAAEVCARLHERHVKRHLEVRLG